jgi:hypothetical protein
MDEQHQDRVPVRRHKISSLRIYDVLGADFDRIEEVPSSVGNDLTIALFSGSCFLTLLVTLLTVEIKDERKHTEFFVAAAVAFAVTWICGYRSWERRGALKSALPAGFNSLLTNPLIATQMQH